MTIKTPVVTALNDSTYTAITLPSAYGRSISARTSDDTAWKMAVDASGTGEVNIPASKSISIDKIKDRDGTIFYAKASSGTPNLEVIWE